MTLSDLKARITGTRLPGESALSGDTLHLAGLRKVFDPLVIAGDCRFDRDLIALAFTNRSGSTYLGQLLASAPDLTGFREDLNHTIVARRAQDQDIPDVTAYLRQIVGNDPQVRGFGLKASAEQLRLIHMIGIDRAFRRTSVIRIRRRDRIAQAVSLWIAWRTRQWTSRQTALQVPLRYDYATLRQQLRAVQDAECALDLVLSVLPYPVTCVDYETLCAEPDQTLAQLRHDLGLPPSEAPPTGWAERQSSEQKTVLVERFRADLARDWSLGSDQSARVINTEFGSST
jgi:LPS sulfotransferase NodH